MSRVLVTGGAGAIGSAVARSLMTAGHTVVILDDLSSGHSALVPTGADFVEGSVTDEHALDRAFVGRPEFVVHLAALFANQNSVDHPERDLEVNGRGTLRVLERSAERGVRKLLYASSSCVYGPKTIMHETDADFQPDTPYAITKLLGEYYCRFWSMHHKLDTAIVRIFNTYGPGEFPGRYRNVIPNFFALAMQGQPLPITGTGEETRDFNYVDDTAAGIVAALLAHTEPAAVFNLASGRETRILDLASMINRIASNGAGIERRAPRSWDHVTTRCGTIDRARAVLGYSPAVDLETGLQRTYEWLRANL